MFCRAGYARHSSNNDGSPSDFWMGPICRISAGNRPSANWSWCSKARRPKWESIRHRRAQFGLSVRTRRGGLSTSSCEGAKAGAVSLAAARNTISNCGPLTVACISDGQAIPSKPVSQAKSKATDRAGRQSSRSGSVLEGPEGKSPPGGCDENQTGQTHCRRRPELRNVATEVLRLGNRWR